MFVVKNCVTDPSGGQATAGEFPAGAHAAADAGEGAALRGISAQPACPRPRLQATGRPALRREPHPRTRQPARQRRPRGRLLHFSSLAPVKLLFYVPYVAFIILSVNNNTAARIQVQNVKVQFSYFRIVVVSMLMH